jgi:hypothetical protein
MQTSQSRPQIGTRLGALVACLVAQRHAWARHLGAGTENSQKHARLHRARSRQMAIVWHNDADSDLLPEHSSEGAVVRRALRQTNGRMVEWSTMALVSVGLF